MSKGKKETKNEKSKLEIFTEVSLPQKVELTYGEGDNKFIVIVDPVIKLEDKVLMVGEIANGVFMEQEGKDVYVPEYFEFWEKYVALKHFTNIELPTVSEDINRIISYTPIFEDVIAVPGVKTQFYAVIEAAGRAIEMRKREILNRPKTSAFLDSLKPVIRDFARNFKPEDIDKMTASFQDVVGQLTAQFSNADNQTHNAG